MQDIVVKRPLHAVSRVFAFFVVWSDWLVSILENALQRAIGSREKVSVMQCMLSLVICFVCLSKNTLNTCPFTLLLAGENCCKSTFSHSHISGHG